MDFHCPRGEEYEATKAEKVGGQEVEGWQKAEGNDAKSPEEGRQEGHWITCACASMKKDKSGWGTPKGKPGAQPGKSASAERSKLHEKTRWRNPKRGKSLPQPTGRPGPGHKTG